MSDEPLCINVDTFADLGWIVEEHTSVKMANASSKPIFFTIKSRAYKRTIMSRPVKQTMNIIPTMAGLSRDCAKNSRETSLGTRPAASAARISDGIVIANYSKECHDLSR